MPLLDRVRVYCAFFSQTDVRQLQPFVKFGATVFQGTSDCLSFKNGFLLSVALPFFQTANPVSIPSASETRSVRNA